MASWIALKLVSGKTFADIFSGPIDDALALLEKTILLDLYLMAKDQIVSFHKSSFIHRDTHLGNFIVSPLADSVTLIDYGICENSRFLPPEVVEERRRQDFVFMIFSFHQRVIEDWWQGSQDALNMDSYHKNISTNPAN